MSFSADLKRFVQKVDAREQEIFTGVVDLAHGSIQVGSAVTGAPGQPVDTGNLRASWQKWFESPREAVIATNVVYAPGIEDGVGPHGPIELRSPVGGFHSVALTRAGFKRIVEHVSEQVKGGAQ